MRQSLLDLFILLGTKQANKKKNTDLIQVKGEGMKRTGKILGCTGIIALSYVTEINNEKEFLV